MSTPEPRDGWESVIDGVLAARALLPPLTALTEDAWRAFYQSVLELLPRDPMARAALGVDPTYPPQA